MSRSGLIVVLALALPCIALFATVAGGQHSFVFRDAAHYYYPLFEWTAGEWASGSLPLWNPQENGGAPSFADPTASMLYPGKLIFAAPLPFPLRYNLYVVGHVLLAAWWTFLLARQWNRSLPAACLAGLSYAFGGYVLFQTCNIIYLVGAAWLPLALGTTERMLRQRRSRWAIASAVCLAMMVLGGDAQLAYNVGLLAGLYALLLWRRERASRRRLGVQSDERSRRKPPRFALLLAAGFGAFALSAVQVLPSSQWARSSERAVFAHPRSIYEIPASLSRGGDSATSVGRGLWGPLPVGHHRHIYAFSLAPWHLLESVWPNFSGRPFPLNRRWTSMFPGEGRMWVPSLYAGLLPLMLGLSAWSVRRAGSRRRWLSWSLLLSVFASFGWYGVGWLLHEMGGAFSPAKQPQVGQPVGGLYWAMVVLLPGYAYFRYPAKLLVISSLCLSLLAAEGWDRVVGRERTRKILRWLTGLGGLSVLLAALVAATRFAWMDKVHSAFPNRLFGPLDGPGASTDLVATFVHTSVVCLLLGLLLRRGLTTRKVPAAGLLLLTGLELALANHWLVPTAPISYWQRSSLAAQRIARDPDPNRKDSIRVFRGSQRQWFPEQWAIEGSKDRNREGMLWDRATLFPRYQLLNQTPRRIALLEVRGASMSHEWQTLFQVAREKGAPQPSGARAPAPSVLRALGTDYLVLPEDAQYPDAQPLAWRPAEIPENMSIWRLNHPSRRAWIVHRVETIRAGDAHDPQRQLARMRHIWFPGGRARDLTREAVVETSHPSVVSFADLGANGASQLDSPRESCRIIQDNSEVMHVRVQLSAPGMLIVNASYDDDWTATVRRQADPASAREQRVWRANGVMRGVRLPAGHHEVHLQYRPQSVYLGGAISGLSWLLLLAGASWWRFARRKTKRASSLTK